MTSLASEPAPPGRLLHGALLRALFKPICERRVGLAALLFAATAGAAAVLYVITPYPLNPRHIDWLIGDPFQHWIGWEFYRQDPGWHWPITWTDRVGYPLGVSIAYLDSIPLLALVLRPLSPLLGEPFQQIGPYAGLCVLLQAYFAFRLAYRVGLTSPLAAAAGGIFLATAPAFLNRLGGHIPHASHWLILAALLAYLREPPSGSSARWMAPLWVLIFLAGGINAYVALLCLLVSMAAAARLRLAGSVTTAGAVLHGLASLLTLVLAWTLFGYLSGGSLSDYSGGGYRLYSMNLLAPFDPAGPGGLLYGALPRATSGQYEGYNYLGLGALVLLGAAILGRRWSVEQLRSPAVLPLLAIGLLCIPLATSATITAGGYTLADIPLPETMEMLAGAYRSSGRFFWLAHYLLLLAAVASLARLRRPRGEMILCGLAVLQLADIEPLATAIHDGKRARVEQVLTNPLWRTLGRDHARLIVLPAWQCDQKNTPGGQKGFEIFGREAIEQHLATNSYYPGRMGKHEFRVHCVDLPNAVTTGVLDPEAAYVVSDAIGVLDPEAAYVVSDAIGRTLLSSEIRTHRCSKIDGFNLCVRDALHPGVELDLAAPLPRGDWVDFGAHGRGGDYDTGGWSRPESWGRWSIGPKARLIFRAPEDGAFAIQASLRAFVPPQRPTQVVRVVLNGRTVDTWTFEAGDPEAVRELSLPPDLIRGSRSVQLDFEIEDPRSPLAVGTGTDERLLGIGLSKLRLVEIPATDGQ